jgi:hypothetical protein
MGGFDRAKITVFVGNTTRMDNMGYVDRRPGATAALLHDDICMNVV